MAGKKHKLQNYIRFLLKFSFINTNQLEVFLTIFGGY